MSVSRPIRTLLKTLLLQVTFLAVVETTFNKYPRIAILQQKVLSHILDVVFCVLWKIITQWFSKAHIVQFSCSRLIVFNDQIKSTIPHRWTSTVEVSARLQVLREWCTMPSSHGHKAPEDWKRLAEAMSIPNEVDPSQTTDTSCFTKIVLIYKGSEVIALG